MSAPRILVVEDDRDCRESLADVLELEDWTVALVDDGLAALELLDGPPPDVVLTDLRMRRMSGDELLAAIRAQRRLDDVPVVVMTGADAAEVPPGAFAVLLKPFAPEELFAVVGRALEARRRAG